MTVCQGRLLSGSKGSIWLGRLLAPELSHRLLEGVIRLNISDCQAQHLGSQERMRPHIQLPHSTTNNTNNPDWISHACRSTKAQGARPSQIATHSTPLLCSHMSFACPRNCACRLHINMLQRQDNTRNLHKSYLMRMLLKGWPCSRGILYTFKRRRPGLIVTENSGTIGDLQWYSTEYEILADQGTMPQWR